MIRKSMICVALASMALATSCSQDDLASEYSLSKTPIKMNTSFGLSTRAVETTVSNLGSFRVSAFQDGKANYMSGVEYTSADGSAWSTTAGTFFWPVSGDLRMYCYAPDQPGQSGTYTLNKDTQILSDFMPNTAAADQKDFVYAKSTGNAAQNGSTGIDINFQHALSEITIAAKNSNKAYTVEVTGVKLGNIGNKGTFTFPNANISALWTLTDPNTDKQDYTTTWTTPVALGADGTTMDAANVPFMLIPQQLEDADKASEGAYIAAKVKITMQGGQIVYDNWSYVGIDTKWEMGKRYAYTLDFSNGAGQDENGNPILSGTTVKLNCSVTPWDEISEVIPFPAIKGTYAKGESSFSFKMNEDYYDVTIKPNLKWKYKIGDPKYITSLQEMFMGKDITSVNLNELNTSNVKDMNAMFRECKKLTSLDLSKLNISKVTSMQYMFNNCSNLTSLDLSNWKLSSNVVTNYMFYGSGITTIYMRNCDAATIKVIQDELDYEGKTGVQIITT